MKKISILFLVPALAFSACGTSNEAGADGGWTYNDSVNYALGIKVANDLKATDLSVNEELVCQGVKEALGEAPPSQASNSADSASLQMGRKIGRALLENKCEVNTDALSKGIKDSKGGNPMLKAEMVARMVQGMFPIDYAKEGRDFMAKNATAEGVQSLPSGIQYRVLKSGDPSGKKPTLQNTVTCHYRGTLLDGKEFDSSYSRNEPTSFPLNGVISGWQQTLQQMKPGDKWEVWIPGDLAYGPMGSPPKIPGNATLKFEIELISFQ